MSFSTRIVSEILSVLRRSAGPIFLKLMSSNNTGWRDQGVFRAAWFIITILILVNPARGIAGALDAEKAYDSGHYAKARELWLPMAEQGDPTAQYNIATLYRLGRGVRADPVVATEWYQRAALLGHARSQVNLGRLYLSGTGVQRNILTAISWFQRAADSGDSFGQYFLGLQYLTGKGVSQNYKQAASFFLVSAEQGLRDSAYELAVLYKRGEGLPQDHAEAIKWFSSAAYAGHIDAQFSMGVIYEEGQGTPINLERAYFWYSVSASNRHPVGMDNRDRVAHDLTSDQLSSVHSNLKHWDYLLK